MKTTQFKALIVVSILALGAGITLGMSSNWVMPLALDAVSQKQLQDCFAKNDMEGAEKIINGYANSSVLDVVNNSIDQQYRPLFTEIKLKPYSIALTSSELEHHFQLSLNANVQSAVSVGAALTNGTMRSYSLTNGYPKDYFVHYSMSWSKLKRLLQDATEESNRPMYVSLIREVFYLPEIKISESLGFGGNLSVDNNGGTLSQSARSQATTTCSFQLRKDDYWFGLLVFKLDLSECKKLAPIVYKGNKFDDVGRIWAKTMPLQSINKKILKTGYGFAFLKINNMNPVSELTQTICIDTNDATYAVVSSLASTPVSPPDIVQTASFVFIHSNNVYLCIPARKKHENSTSEEMLQNLDDDCLFDVQFKK